MIRFKDGSRLEILEDKIIAYSINSSNTICTVDVGNKQYELQCVDIQPASWDDLVDFFGFK